jgi:hypothetical protein
MPPRPALSSKRRPLSAIFLGVDPAPASSNSDLPDLPEPPSPGASSTHSGLPSPPATNSTGSGSTGDRRESLDRPTTSSTLTMRNEKPLISRPSRASSPSGSTEYKKDEGEEEEDSTARFNLGRRRGASESNDHIMTLQRVMSLTQRNRMVSVYLLSYHSRPYVGLSHLLIFPSIHLHPAAYRPSTNSLLCASTHRLHLSRLIPHVLLVTPPPPFHQVPHHRSLLAPALNLSSPQHCPGLRQSASLAPLIPTRLMINPLHLLPLSPSHTQF